MSSSDRLKAARERSRMRKELLKHTLGVDDLSEALGSKPPPPLPSQSEYPAGDSVTDEPPATKESNAPESAAAPATTVPEKPDQEDEMANASKRRVSRDKGSSSERTAKRAHSDDNDEFHDSTAFLKGTQSRNPHNDYSQNFVDTGQRPQNFIRDVGLADRFEVSPKSQSAIVSPCVSCQLVL